MDRLYTKDYKGLNFSRLSRRKLYNSTGLDYFDGERVDTTNPWNDNKDNIALLLNQNFNPIGSLKMLHSLQGFRQERVDYKHSDCNASYSTHESLTAWDVGINYVVERQLSFFGNLNHAYQAPDIDRFFVGVYRAAVLTPWLRRDFNGFIKPQK